MCYLHIHILLQDLPFPFAYLNDIIVYSKTAVQHLDHLWQVFHKLCNAESTMKLSKCHICSKEIQYLGHVLSITGIKQLPFKSSAIKLMNPPKNAKQVSISLTCWLLLQVHQEFCSHSETS